jgi:glutaryl-CoA dehydrogenase
VLRPSATRTFDREIFREMGELGLLGPTIPDRYGGAGLNYVCYGLVAREVERVDSGYRSAMSVQSSPGDAPDQRVRQRGAAQKYLPKLATGEWVGCFGLTEPNHGSDPGSMVTRAKPVDGGYSLKGAKMWITNSRSPTCSWSGPRTTAVGKIRGFILEQGHGQGLSAPAIDSKVGLRASITGEIVMDERVLPRGKRLPRGARPEGPVHLPEQRALRHRLGRAGRGRDCWHRARQYVLDRQQFGRPLAANQLIQKKLADMQTEIASACRAACAGPHEGRRHGRPR